MNILNESELLQANGGLVGALIKGAGRLIARNPKTIASGLGFASLEVGLEVGDAVASQKQDQATERYLNANQEYNDEYVRLAGGRS